MIAGMLGFIVGFFFSLVIMVGRTPTSPIPVSFHFISPQMTMGISTLSGLFFSVIFLLTLKVWSILELQRNLWDSGTKVGGKK